MDLEQHAKRVKARAPRPRPALAGWEAPEPRDAQALSGGKAGTGTYGLEGELGL